MLKCIFSKKFHSETFDPSFNTQFYKFDQKLKIICHIKYNFKKN